VTRGLFGDLPAQLVQRQPTWRAAWRRGLLTVFVHGEGAAAPVGAPLLIPLLAHGRSGKTTRFLPLASCQHLGLYGADALAAVHAVLGSLLFAQPPTNLALMIIDQNQITPLYRNVAHFVPLPADGDEPLKLLADAIRHHIPTGDARHQMRPLLLVVVEPDDARLHALHTIIARLRARPESPLSDAVRARKQLLLRRMLADDAQIRDLTQPWLRQLEAMLCSSGNEKRLEGTYGRQP
jgi:hypothetical protein